MGAGLGWMAGGGSSLILTGGSRGPVFARRPMAFRKMLSSSSMELETGWTVLGFGGGVILPGAASSFPRSCFSFARSFFQAI